MGVGVMNQLDGVPALIELALGLTALAGAGWAGWLKVWKPYKERRARMDAGMDTLLGYPAVNDPGSGREIQPATPPLAARVYDLEETNRKMADALEILAANQKDIMRIQNEMDERKRIGERLIADWTVWRQGVDHRLQTWVGEQDQLAVIVRENAKEEDQT